MIDLPSPFLQDNFRPLDGHGEAFIYYIYSEHRMCYIKGHRGVTLTLNKKWKSA